MGPLTQVRRDPIIVLIETCMQLRKYSENTQSERVCSVINDVSRCVLWKTTPAGYVREMGWGVSLICMEATLHLQSIVDS